jgi:hypothetical protein
MGEWKWTAGEFHGDPNDKGIQTSGDAQFHFLAAELNEPCNKMETDLVIQMSVKYEQGVCGGEISIILGGDRGLFTFDDVAPDHVKFTIRDNVTVKTAGAKSSGSYGTFPSKPHDVFLPQRTYLHGLPLHQVQSYRTHKGRHRVEAIDICAAEQLRYPT